MSYDCLLFKVVLGRVSLKKPVRVKALNCSKEDMHMDTTVETKVDTTADKMVDTTMDMIVDTTVETIVDTTVETIVDTTVETMVETTVDAKDQDNSKVSDGMAIFI